MHSSQDNELYKSLLYSFKNKDNLKFFFRFLGSVLGSVYSSKKIFIFESPLCNYIIQLIHALLGSYCVIIDYKDIIAQNHNCQRLLDLHGARLLIIEGIPKNMELDGVLFLLSRHTPLQVKIGCNEERIVNLPPTAAIFTPYMPKLVDGYIFKGSFYCIELAAGISNDDINDLILEPRNLSFILRLILDELKELRTVKSYSPPDDVVVSTRDLIISGDDIRAFINECLEKDESYNLTTVQAYNEYKEWVQHNCLGKPASDRAFLKRLREIGITVDPRGTHTRCIYGYKLIHFNRPTKIKWDGDYTYNIPVPLFASTHNENQSEIDAEEGGKDFKETCARLKKQKDDADLEKILAVLPIGEPSEPVSKYAEDAELSVSEFLEDSFAAEVTELTQDEFYYSLPDVTTGLVAETTTDDDGPSPSIIPIYGIDQILTGKDDAALKQM